MSNQIRGRLKYLKSHSTGDATECSVSAVERLVSHRYCKQCHSRRDGENCWKCGTETFVPAEGWVEQKLPPVDRIRELAKEVGYAIGEHGTKERDLDLIAVPWINTCSDAVDLMMHIADGINGKLVGTVENKPHGRLGCNIQIDGYYKLIDLSVCPTLGG